MKRILLSALWGIVCVLFCNGCSGSGNSNGNDGSGSTKVKKPLNITVFIDLSDRIEKNTHHVSSETKDLEIFKHLTASFKEKAVSEKIVPCEDRMEVFFYPVPNASEIINLSKGLIIDLAKVNIKKKKEVLNQLDVKWDSALSQIYAQAKAEKKYHGADIYGFVGKKINSQCVLPNYRNVLIILSDGYPYDVKSANSYGNNEFSYVTPKLLRQYPNAKLKPLKVDLSNLEILLLEVDEANKGDYYKLQTIWADWLNGMNVKRFEMAETDLPNQTQKVIDAFLKQ
ncbi:MAG: hypothetical protein MJ069_01945 [Salinivirgaceae bacterium]|nr:hypothetical protein [Salinivirgaceae bacterium]